MPEVEWKVGVINPHVTSRNYLSGEIVEVSPLRATILFYFRQDAALHASIARRKWLSVTAIPEYAARVSRASVENVAKDHVDQR